MFTAKEISTDHKDLIHDVSYDFYGRRMATCSSDQSVKVSAFRFLLYSGQCSSYEFNIQSIGHGFKRWRVAVHSNLESEFAWRQ